MDQLSTSTGSRVSPQNPSSIQEMFGSLSKHYDFANTVLSCGIHHIWKKRLVHESGLLGHEKLLDCATGTGDLSFLFAKEIASLGGMGTVVGSDFCQPMLDVAQAKAMRLQLPVKFEFADLMKLPYADGRFDQASISFGIRNVKDPAKALAEMGRVVKSGGKVLVLEFGQPEVPILSQAYSLYSKWLLPTLGGWISGNPKAYHYLQTSSANFPCRTEFLALAKATSLFKETQYIPLSGGIAYLYILRRI